LPFPVTSKSDFSKLPTNELSKDGERSCYQICNAAGGNCKTPDSLGVGSGDMAGSNNLSELTDASAARTNLGLGSAATSASTDFAAAAHTSNTSNPHSVTKAQVGLTNVEDTALSTWTGSANIATVGTIATGTWQGTQIADAYIPAAIARDSEVTYKTESDLTTALDDNYAPLTHTSLTNNPHTVTAAQVNLANVTNESKTTMFDDPAFTGLTSTTGDTTTEVPFTVDSPVSQTANLQEWKVNTAVKASLAPDGSINVYQICNAAGGNCKSPDSLGVGSGDMTGSNNLSELTDASAARTTLGLGSAATSASTDFSPAAHSISTATICVREAF